MVTDSEDNESVKFYRIKDEVRILGIDDAPFNLQDDGKTMLVGAILRGGSSLDGVLRSEIEIDGMDATKKIVSMVKKTRHKDIRVIILDGITFGGFNIVDIKEIFGKTKIPVIVIIRRMPDFRKIFSALKKVKDEKRNHKKRLKFIENAGTPKRVEIEKQKRKSVRKYVYIQYHGIRFEDAKNIVRISATRSLVPEPVRVAHLIASGIKLGESVGRA